ncbi:protein SIEVE ELEMENT OCCLUSION B-like isoform X2 [Macadamia integrifolia]|uniref:protein SIEVE ELEMENT OCCLUSION B-like isoform X2 n=1 Tax=Macadamia integrifolia TaxID=60698 RepID=UPI001C4EAEAA|nr:protein SIEVE ELEMENT OCCLUSION B-like isoform X2 [Macadamia integrifolia]
MAPQQQHSEGHDQFTTSDDNVMIKQILATHANHNFHKVDLRPHLQIIKKIVQHSTTLECTNVHDEEVSSHMESLDEKIRKVDFVGMLESLAYTIHKISNEISCKCFGGGDAHWTTVELLKSLSKFSWDAKVVVALAAFGVTYGEFWLVVELYQTHPLAKSIALLKQLPDIFEQLEKLKPRFEALWSLIKAMLDVTKCIVQFHELPPQYISPNQPPMLVATALIPTAVYWTIRSVVACVSDVIGLIGLDHKYVIYISPSLPSPLFIHLCLSIPFTVEAGELSNLEHKVNKIHEHLTKQLEICNQHVDEMKELEAYNPLVQLFETSQVDNMNILKALIPASKDDLRPLVYGPTRTRFGIEVLRYKWSLLLISDLYISREEFTIFNQIMCEMRWYVKQKTEILGLQRIIGRFESGFQVVWIPVVDKTLPWTETMQRDYDRLQATMPEYSVHQPSLINPGVIKYFKEMWHFNKKPILVVLNGLGKVENPNALHMLWIWRSFAFNFSSNQEKELWSSETWRLEFLVDGIDEDILRWVKEEEQFICLYGGEDIIG